MPEIQNIVVLGGGTAGLIAALTLRRQLPQLAVRLVHSAEIGVIGVGEGTTPLFPRHIFGVLGLDPARFYAEAQPTWKLGIHFLWGPRKDFFYSFGQQWDARWSDLPKAHGYYCFDDLVPADAPAALMAHDRVAHRRPDGWPQFPTAYAFHIENKKLVAYLEARCCEDGVTFTEGTVSDVEMRDGEVAALHLESGEKVSGDLYIDASGFRSELLGRELGEPFESFADALFCDRAIIGGWPRTNESIHPCTTAETMEAGWCWQIEHEHFINRGYVFSSAFLSDDAAREELLRKNPKIAAAGIEPRVVRFRSGRFARNWVGNVVAIGNANGFVEPLEATAISTLIYAMQTLTEALRECHRAGSTPTLRETCNRLVADIWTETRDFLAMHYRFNTRLETPFWQHARAATPLRTVGPLVAFYEENGPSMLGRHELGRHDNIFGIEGHWMMLLGNRVPHRAPHAASDDELARWKKHAADFAAQAAGGITLHHALACIRHPGWRWK